MIRRNGRSLPFGKQRECRLYTHTVARDTERLGELREDDGFFRVKRVVFA
jgi:hypothetical protein